jgi:acetylornithine/N-succinyldiaminopimelate aminotransferase
LPEGSLPCSQSLTIGLYPTEDIFQIGDHGSTFGGNLLAAAAGLVVLEIVNNPDFLKEISRKGEKIVNTLKSWNHPKFTEIRGRGLMVGIDITEDAWPILEKCITRTQTGQGISGLLLLSAGKQTLRMLPPYIINDAEIEEGLAILKAMI